MEMIIYVALECKRKLEKGSPKYLTNFQGTKI